MESLEDTGVYYALRQFRQKLVIKSTIDLVRCISCDHKVEKLMLCSKCGDKRFVYCGEDCFAKHWKLVHKKECKGPVATRVQPTRITRPSTGRTLVLTKIEPLSTDCKQPQYTRHWYWEWVRTSKSSMRPGRGSQNSLWTSPSSTRGVGLGSPIGHGWAWSVSLFVCLLLLTNGIEISLHNICIATRQRINDVSLLLTKYHSTNIWTAWTWRQQRQPDGWGEDAAWMSSISFFLWWVLVMVLFSPPPCWR